MKKKVNIKIVIIIGIIFLLIGISIFAYMKFNADKIDEFSKYIEISDTNNLKGFETLIENDKITFTKKTKMKEFIGETNLIRYKNNNLFISNDFKFVFKNADEENIETSINKFIDECKKYVNCEKQTVNLHIQTTENKQIDDEKTLLEKITNEGVIANYYFEKDNKSYRVSIYKEKENIIGTFSYNGKYPKAKTPEELTQEDKIKSTEKLEKNENNLENGVG